MSATVEKFEFQLPNRLRGLQPTLIRQFFERALPDSINFGLGEPDLPTPQFMRNEAARVAVEEQNGYTSHAGLITLREKIAEQYPHLDLTPADVVVTVGSQEAMTAAFLSIVDEGDDVLIPNPSFPAYDACVKIAEGNPVYYRLPAEKGFAFDIEEFKRSITPKTKAAVVISPSNPTGKIFTESDLRQMADALRGTGIYLISDEIYSDLYFNEKPHSASEFYDRTIVVTGLSKSLSMTGWRLGWLATTQKEISRAALVLHGFLTVCTSTITQKAALLGWSGEAERAKREAREIYTRTGQISRRSFRIRSLACMPLRRKELFIRCSTFVRWATIWRSLRSSYRTALSRYRELRSVMKQRVFCGYRSATPKTGWPKAYGG